MPVYPACGSLLPLPVHGSAQVGTSELGLSSEVPTCHEQLGGSNLSRTRPKAMSLDECERIEFNLYSCFEYMRIGLEKNVMIVILRHRYRFVSFWLSLLSLSS